MHDLYTTLKMVWSQNHVNWNFRFEPKKHQSLVKLEQSIQLLTYARSEQDDYTCYWWILPAHWFWLVFNSSYISASVLIKCIQNTWSTRVACINISSAFYMYKLIVRITSITCTGAQLVKCTWMITVSNCQLSLEIITNLVYIYWNCTHTRTVYQLCVLINGHIQSDTGFRSRLYFFTQPTSPIFCQDLLVIRAILSGHS